MPSLSMIPHQTLDTKVWIRYLDTVSHNSERYVWVNSNSAVSSAVGKAGNGMSMIKRENWSIVLFSLRLW